MEECEILEKIWRYLGRDKLVHRENEIQVRKVNPVREMGFNLVYQIWKRRCLNK